MNAKILSNIKLKIKCMAVRYAEIVSEAKETSNAFKNIRRTCSYSSIIYIYSHPNI